MPITRYENQTFIGETFKIEECRLVNCVLKGCIILYSGGLFELLNTRMENCQWQFLDEAQRTVQLLGMIGALKNAGQVPLSMPSATGSIN